MPKVLLRSLLLSMAALFVLSLTPMAAFAHDGAHEIEDTSSNEAVTTLRDKVMSEKDEHQQDRQNKLTEAKLKICEVRKKNITRIMTRSVTRAENQLGVFTKISDRVQAFYVKKGKNLSNYDELVSAVHGAKAQAQADIATLKTLNDFTCDGDDPKGDAAAFKAALETVRSDLKAYRTAVKNLIVGVKSVQSTTVKEGEQQ
jgi:TolA-binding protein